MSRRSLLQKQVLSLYKKCLRASQGKPGFRETVRTEFRRNMDTPTRDTMRIEFMLRQGEKKLKLIQHPDVAGMQQLGKKSQTKKMSGTHLIRCVNLGKLPYRKAMKLMERVVKAQISERSRVPNTEKFNTVLLVEHNPVYTVGIRSSLYPPSEEMRLKEMGAEFYRTSRGGLITFHGPGQLVAYPVLNLQVWTPSVKWYVCQLEKTIIELCHQLDIYASTSPYTGVWVQNKKIAAIGIRMSRWVTSHGIGLNCNTDLSWFDHIVPCGIADKGVTSLSQEVGGDVSVSDATPFFLSAFSHVFHCSFKSQTLDELWYDLDNSSR